MKALIITTMRNEAAFMLEWIAHHRAIGFSDFLIFTNDCDDGTAAMADRLAQLGGVFHQPNPGPWDEGPQWAALKAAQAHPAYQSADWVMVLDVDEFVNIKAGDGSLQALMQAAPGCDAYPLTWRMFGNGGQIRYHDRPVTETFTACAPEILFWPWRALMVKTLYRRAAFAKPGVHRPKGGKSNQIWYDPSLNARLFSAPGRPHYALAQINHYALGAMESYIVKCDRGRANRQAGAFDMSYWVDRNFSNVEERSIARIVSQPARDALLADPVLQRLHQAAVAWRHQKFQSLMTEEPWRALFGRLLLTPPSRVLTFAQAALIHQAQGQAEPHSPPQP